MSNLSIEGTLKVIYGTTQITDRFKKREFVILAGSDEYPEHIKMQLTQDRCALLDGFKEGDTAKVSFNLRGKPYEKNGETMYFTNLDAWRIEALGQQQPPERKLSSPAAVNVPVAQQTAPPADVDDVPF